MEEHYRELREQLHEALNTLQWMKLKAAMADDPIERVAIGGEALDYITKALEEIDGSSYPDNYWNRSKGSEAASPQTG